MKKIEFYKYHGLGNDFLIIDLIKHNYQIDNFNDFALKICSRNFGVGADGIMVLSRNRRADGCLDLFNSDGSWAEKSGNGLRAVGAYYFSNYFRRKLLTFEINKELAEIKIIGAKKDIYSVEVSLGKPEFLVKKIPMKSRGKYHINKIIEIDGARLPVTSLSVGNPHTVMFVDSFGFDWKELGQIIENCHYFPHRTNVEFVKIINRSCIELNDWERGAGATGSSGTGAAAAVVAGVVNGLLGRRVKVVFPAGSLHINWRADDDIILTGPAQFVCSGQYIYNS